MAALYDWVPISRGQPLPAGVVMSGRTGSDGDVYVGRNGAGEVGKINLDGGKMYNIWCHAGGSSQTCEILVLRAGATVEWRPYKHHQMPPDGAVWAGVTRTDGKHGVFVGRDRHGACGKLNLTDADGKLNNLWIHGNWSGLHEGEILLVNGSTYAGTPGPAPPMPSAGSWNPNVQCDGIRAEERVLYLQQHDGLAVDAARQKVMSEFPAQFGLAVAPSCGKGGGYGGGPSWNPNAMCDGSRAEERATWLQQNKGLTLDAARRQIMQEFPAQFLGAAGHGGHGKGGHAGHHGHGHAWGWDPNTSCDGVRAEERSLYLQQHDGMTVDAARQKVMSEFPCQFKPSAAGPRWNPNAMCDGSRAEERADWLHQNKGMTKDAARKQVMDEFPAAFH